MSLKSSNNVAVNTTELILEISAEDFNKALLNAYKKEKNQIQIKGFRKGKAPMSVIERYYGEEVFFDTALNDLLPAEMTAALEETKLDIVDRGDDEIMPDEVATFQPFYPKHFHHLEKYTDGFENSVYYPVYRIGLEDIIEAAQTDEGYRYAKELWIDEMGDFYTAWNLLQLVIFGEVVYG